MLSFRISVDKFPHVGIEVLLTFCINRKVSMIDGPCMYSLSLTQIHIQLLYGYFLEITYLWYIQYLIMPLIRVLVTLSVFLMDKNTSLTHILNALRVNVSIKEPWLRIQRQALQLPNS